ncbi:MAG TPA: tyrosine-type recombinase/integrase [Bacillota bacterium]|nr:tyrosine-type recombinase/integrase [Bacillota bacterium]
MATIKQDPNTKTWFFIFDHYENGKRKQIKRRGFKTKREANEKLVELQKEVQDNKYVSPNQETLGGFMKHWLEHERKMQCDSTTHYNNTLYYKNQIAPRMGSIKIQDLSPFLCQKFIHDMHEDGYAYNTIDRVASLIKLALDRAVVYKLIKENHMRKVCMPKNERMEMKVWNTDQVNTFLNFTKNRRFFPVYALALLTGMRQGEILGLRWKDIDFEKKTIAIRQILTHYGKNLKKGAKTKAGERTISIPDALIPILKQHRKSFLELKMKLGNQFEDLDLVIFNLSNGKTVYPSNLTKNYLKDVERSGLPRIRFHDLRHTHATILIEQGVNPKVIQERLGHKKIHVTLDTYSHVLPSMQQEAADKLDNVIYILF